MAKFCPKCGTRDPDDAAVFCNKCGSPMPPPVPETMDRVCPSCGTTIPDSSSVFCNKCGSPLPASPVTPVRYGGARPAGAGPVFDRKHCPSCGAPLAEAGSEFCNACGADLRGYVSRPAAPGPYGDLVLPFPGKAVPVHRPPVQAMPGEPVRPFPERTGPVFRPPVPVTPAEPVPPFPERTPAGPRTPVSLTPAEDYEPFPEEPVPPAEIPEDGGDIPQKPGRKPLLKWGLIAVGVVILLVILASFVPGMLAGANKTSNATSPAPVTTKIPATPKPATPAPPAPTQPPATAVPTTVVPVSVAPTGTANASATATPKPTGNATANSTANATANVTAAPTIPPGTQVLSIGQGAYDGKGKLTLNGFSWRDKVSDPIPSYAFGKKYLILDLTYSNLQQNATLDVPLTGQLSVTDGGGFPYDMVSDSALEDQYLGNGIPPQQNRTGNVAFLVPPEATFLKLQYNFGTLNNASFQLT